MNLSSCGPEKVSMTTIEHYFEKKKNAWVIMFIVKLACLYLYIYLHIYIYILKQTFLVALSLWLIVKQVNPN